jgi:alcohol dehydrogenase (cytochrome c)
MLRSGSEKLLATCLLSGLATIAAADTAPSPTGADWEGYNKTLEGQRYSLLNQINASNAANLAEVCRVRVSARGSLQSGLLVIADSMFLATPTETFALDPVNCRIRWQHTYRRSQEPGLSVNRGVAHLNGRIFRGTDDGRLLALDATTGKEIWTSVVGDPTVGEYVSAAPIAWNGLVILGISGGEFGIRGRILAYDALNGREVWRFHTIPIGKEFGADTWGDSKWAEHGGGGTWSTFTIDPTTAEVFAPIGNPVPDFAPTDRPGANLFTNSVLGLDARTGELRWWYQLQANDDHDHDLGAAPMLFRNSRHEHMLAAAGKDGLLHVVDRATRKVIYKTPVTTVDSPRKKVTTEGVKVCPGAAGGVQWNGPALDPRRMTIFVGAVDMCMMMKSSPGSKFTPRGLNFGGSAGPAGDTPTGWVTAVDANTGAVRWKYHAEAPVLGGVTPTAGGIVMTGDNAGNFLVFESDSGKLLRKEATGGSLAGGVVTYSRGGKQYVAFTSGNVSPTGFGSVGRPSVVVMSLPEVTPASAASEKPDAARGKQIYVQACAVCHGPDGDRIAGKELKTVSSRMNAQKLLAFILDPLAPMPKVFPEPRTAEDERDARDVAAYVAEWPR